MNYIEYIFFGFKICDETLRILKGNEETTFVMGTPLSETLPWKFHNSGIIVGEKLAKELWNCNLVIWLLSESFLASSVFSLQFEIFKNTVRTGAK